MANRSTTGQDTQRDQTSDRQQQGAGAERSAAQQQAAGGAEGAVRTDRERSVETGREVGRPRRATGLQQQRGGVTPWTGQQASPFSVMRRMMDDMDRMFENVGLGRSFGLAPLRGFDEFDDLLRPQAIGQGTAIWAPPLEVFERGNDLVIRADLPGLDRNDVNVEVENGVLTLSGERRSEHEENREGFYRSERSYGTFSRSVALPEGVNEEQVRATFKDGVLEITMPRPKEEQRRRRIDVK